MVKLYDGKTGDEVLAIANSLEMCKWCNGSGSDGLSAPIHHCPDCGSTGYKDGPAAERIIDLACEVQHDREYRWR